MVQKLMQKRHLILTFVLIGSAAAVSASQRTLWETVREHFGREGPLDVAVSSMISTMAVVPQRRRDAEQIRVRHHFQWRSPSALRRRSGQVAVPAERRSRGDGGRLNHPSIDDGADSTYRA